MQWNIEEDKQNRSELGRNRLTLMITRIKVTAALIVLWLSDRFLWIRFAAARRFSSPGKSVVTLALIAAIAVPAVCFMHERSIRIAQESQLRYLAATVISENSALKNTLRDLFTERMQLRSLLLDAGYQVETPRELHIKVVATGYSSSPFETDTTPFITASNTTTRPGIIALSRDLLKPYTPDAPFAFGDRVWLDGFGEFIVEDSMHHRWERSADIWFPSRNQALHFGRRELYLSRINNNQDLLGRNALDQAN
jgi:3D (Asp-Asp-Asp) domain-containing protein